MASSSSDAETVLGEDSPLSPCIWSHTAAVDERRQSLATETSLLSSEPYTSQASEPRQAGADQVSQRELLLSPASQLNVLSQISEFADGQARQPAARPEATQTIRQTQRSHVWEPAMGTAKRKKKPRAVVSPTRPKAKKQRKATQKQLARSQTERLASDMLDWETCSEGDLFTVDTATEQAEDQWVYEDISDSDFEA